MPQCGKFAVQSSSQEHQVQTKTVTSSGGSDETMLDTYAKIWAGNSFSAEAANEMIKHDISCDATAKRNRVGSDDCGQSKTRYEK